MKLHLTKKEYRALLDLIAVGDWVLHSHTVQDKDCSVTHRAVMKKIFSYSSEMQCEDLVEYDQKTDECYETCAYEEVIQEVFIQPYNDETFWEELADRLAMRDAVREIGEDNLKTMEPLERVKLLGDKTDTYENEFEEHGLEYLTIIRNNLTAN